MERDDGVGMDCGVAGWAGGRAKTHKSVDSEQQATKTSWAKEEIKGEVNIQIKTKENVNISYQNFDLKSNILNGHDEMAFFFNSSLFYYPSVNFSFYPSLLQPNLPLHSPSPHPRPVPRVTQTCSFRNPFPSSPSFPYYLSS